MKIIEHGDRDKSIGRRRFECYYCGCVFDADKGDYIFQSPIRCDDVSHLIVTCPEPFCNRTIYGGIK